ncbi:hypothetical protein ASPWEDRAFT_27045 [Aspergillus wentii DTO 134E9]|uniref:Uncharacterized protein n=1 Tax=Aspergillus wentii DTO 134E9 TaxID=1073089 RepID=A0A1L9RS11_ASPWE|nr:uncharacterized protein ASPWEDRAFT_27045 [Aspergillus wentii DTO 134E9]KAI9930525.1 hypothetical protein MW887_011279 [Aspergillus wentii]OJJ37684.1 hypothetical protein ASPWEDRAFT_27045 [Aspergillus wentii DTO 134E9]
MIENGTRKKTSSQLLFGVPLTTSEYEYQGKEHFSNIFKKEYHNLLEKEQKPDSESTSQFIIFSNISEEAFRNDFFNSPDRLFSHTPETYIASFKLLLVKMTTQAHEYAHGLFDKLINRKFNAMNDLDLRLGPGGQTEITSGSRSKKADHSYFPLDLPPNRDGKWPTVAIESGYSESKSKLAGDARWWLTESGGDVKTVLTVSVHQTKREIVVKRWGLMNRPTRTDTDKLVPEVVQKVVISQLTNNHPVRVTNAPLTIPFKDFFLRTANQGEEDIVFSEENLEYIADTVWKVHKKV